MTPQTTTNRLDALDWARQQLDFEAVSKAGPNAREVLFKAQTMVPLIRPKASPRTSAVAASAVFLALLLFCPWLPERARLTTVYMVLDQQTARQAQELVAGTVRRLPEGILLGTKFVAHSGAEQASQGSLQLAFTAMSTSGPELQGTVRQALPSRLDASFQQAQELASMHWVSPVTLGGNYLAQLGDGNQAARYPGQQLAADLALHQDLLRDNMARYLSKSGYELTVLSFTDAPATAGTGAFDMVLPAWPIPVGLSVAGFSAMGIKEQDSVHRRAAEFIDRINLAARPASVVDTPQPWLPVLVSVSLPDGRSDRYLTDRLQARIVQPDPKDLLLYRFDVVKVVEDAINLAMPGEDCRIDYETSRGEAYGMRGDLYKVAVKLTGKRSLDEREITGAEEIRDEESVDW